jgi:succinyl-CoA synthetase beta subunit
MNIHEYQAKKILSDYGIATPQGGIAYTPGEAKRVAQNLTVRGPWMLKAQIQSGARATGHFIGHEAGHKGGIRLITKVSNVPYETSQMLNNTLVTEQTGPKGRLVNKVYVEAFKKVRKTFYIGMIINSSLPAITLLISDVINRNIQDIALNQQDNILRINLQNRQSLSDEQLADILAFLSLDNSYRTNIKELVDNLHKMFVELDMQMIEINPIGVLRDKSLVALDAKISFDDNALARHTDIRRMYDDFETDERTLRANKCGFQYNEFDGNIGCIVNGSGLALEAMDLINSKNYALACSLNVKGGVDKDKIAEGIKIIMTNPRVEGILIDIIGGFLRCNLVADGILAATKEIGLNMPMIIRLEGTNKDEAEMMLQQSNLPLVFAANTGDAIDKLIARMEVND